jgi:hypothetical protein
MFAFTGRITKKEALKKGGEGMCRNDGIKQLDSEKAGASIQTMSGKTCSPPLAHSDPR